MTDYRALLWKYLRLVRDEEGRNFVDRAASPCFDTTPSFTVEELAELERLDAADSLEGLVIQPRQEQKQ